jgi:hypothetical protein
VGAAGRGVVQAGTARQRGVHVVLGEVLVRHSAPDLDDRARDAVRLLARLGLLRHGVGPIDHRDGAEHADEQDRDRDKHLDESEAALAGARAKRTHPSPHRRVQARP